MELKSHRPSGASIAIPSACRRPHPGSSRPEHSGGQRQRPPSGRLVRGAPQGAALELVAIDRMQVESLSVSYGDKPAVKSVSLPIRQGEVLALIGPSGCGKTTLLRSLNRSPSSPAARRPAGSRSTAPTSRRWKRPRYAAG